MFLKAGTEDGYVNIIRIEDGSLMHEKLLDKQQGTFHIPHSYIVILILIFNYFRINFRSYFMYCLGTER